MFYPTVNEDGTVERRPWTEGGWPGPVADAAETVSTALDFVPDDVFVILSEAADQFDRDVWGGVDGEAIGLGADLAMLADLARRVQPILAVAEDMAARLDGVPTAALIPMIMSSITRAALVGDDDVLEVDAAD